MELRAVLLFYTKKVLCKHQKQNNGVCWRLEGRRFTIECVVFCKAYVVCPGLPSLKKNLLCIAIIYLSSWWFGFASRVNDKFCFRSVIAVLSSSFPSHYINGDNPSVSFFPN